MLVNEDYYKPIITNFNNSYIQYESKGNKNKVLALSEYLDMIRPYLSDIRNDHKTQGKWRIHSCDIIIEHKLKVNGKFN